MHILTVIGARPQFIKASAVSRAIVAGGLRETLIHTGQHFDSNMSSVFFDELEIPVPQSNLGVGGGTHGQNTGRMIERIEEVMIDRRPDWVLVYGDTDSTLAGALAAVKLHIPVMHVEAGLRSFNRLMPEEINRVVTDHVATALAAPTEQAVRHLDDEGIPAGKVHLVGDVMYDTALFFGVKAESTSTMLSRLGLAHGEYVLATVHRAENTDNPERLKAILEGLDQSGQTVVLPLHPRTKARIEKFELTLSSRLRVIEPVGYLDMVMLEKHAGVIATDSGGVQKEAFFYTIPCVTLRSETEWTELVDAGWNRVVPPSSADAVATAITAALGCVGEQINPYGDGRAAERIVELFGQAGQQ